MRIAIVEDEKEFAKQLMNDLDRYGKESGVAMVCAGLRTVHRL